MAETLPQRRTPLETPWLLAAAVGLLLLVLYVAGACRSIYVGDSGELVAAAATLGIPHPTGYPLYVIAGKLFTVLLPIGSIAFRMSLFSAVAAAAACAVFVLAARRNGAGITPTLLAVGLLATAPSFWSQANIQRVYALNALALSVALACALEWSRRRRPAWLAAAVFSAALGATNHTYMGFFGIALILFALRSDFALTRRPREIALYAIAGFAGLAPYLYLPLRSRANPRLDWGNPESLDAFLGVVLRRGFWQRAYRESLGDLVTIGWDYLSSIGLELAIVGAVAGFAGLWLRRRELWPGYLVLPAILCNVGTMALHGSRSDLFIWHRYYIPSYFLLGFAAAFGFEWLRGKQKRLVAALLVVPLLLVALRYRDFDRSRYRIADDFSRTLLAELPPGAHLAASDDNILFVLIYLHLVEGLRPDLDLILQGVGDAELPALRFDPETDPLFFTHHPNWNHPQLDVRPVGLSFKVERRDSQPPEPRISKTLLDGEEDPRVPKDYLTQNLVGHFHYMHGLNFETRDWPRAQAEFELASRRASGNDVLFYNLGLIYRRNGLFERALQFFERSQELNPRHIASSQDAKASDRIAESVTELERLRSRLAQSGAGAAELDPRTAQDWQRRAARLASLGESLASQGATLRALELTAAADPQGAAASSDG